MREHARTLIRAGRVVDVSGGQVQRLAAHVLTRHLRRACIREMRISTS
jgi:hypothetical protein